MGATEGGFPFPPLDPRILAAMRPYFADLFGNPHSGHAMGAAAEAATEAARAHVAHWLGAEPREIVFTSGAREAANLAIKGLARWQSRPDARAAAPPRRRLIGIGDPAGVAHACLRDLAAEGFETLWFETAPAALADALAVPTLLLSVPDHPGAQALAAEARTAGAAFHLDAAAAAGPWRAAAAGFDLVSCDARALGGPAGIGALRVRHRPRLRLEPILSGGGQERGLRSGTLPVPLIVGFGEACRLASDSGSEPSGRRSSDP